MAPQEKQSTINKRPRKVAAKPTNKKNSKEQEPCPICFEEKPKKRSAFPCGHSTCSTCFIDPRLKCCPICRTGRDGQSAESRRAQDTDAQRSAVDLPVVHMFLGSNGDHPFDVRFLSVSTGPLGTSISQALREAAFARSSGGIGFTVSSASRGITQQDLERMFRRII
jgi:hypothetical protein